MKIDLYTKVVLTVIAVCLVLLVFRDQPLVPTANAQALAGDKPVNVNLAAVDGHRVSENTNLSSLPVRVVGSVSTH